MDDRALRITDVAVILWIVTWYEQSRRIRPTIGIRRDEVHKTKKETVEKRRF